MAKIYVGVAKKHPKFEGSVSIGLTREHLKTLTENLDERGWVNVTVSPRKNEPEKYSVAIDQRG